MPKLPWILEVLKDACFFLQLFNGLGSASGKAGKAARGSPPGILDLLNVPYPAPGGGGYLVLTPRHVTLKWYRAWWSLM